MNRWTAPCLVLAMLSCNSKQQQSSSGPALREVDPQVLPPAIRRSIDDVARRQARAGDGSTTMVHRAYEYTGYSWHRPSSLGKLVAVDVEFTGYTQDFDLDDIDLVDGVTGDNYGSNPHVALLRPTGELAQDEQKEWPVAPAPLRLLLVYAGPKSLESVRLSYWDTELTPKAIPLSGSGPSLPARASHRGRARAVSP